MRISAIGIGAFGAYCTRLLAYSVHNVCCHEVALYPQQICGSDLSRVDNVIQSNDLLFLLADTTQPSCGSVLAACIKIAATAGVQVVVIGPHLPLHQHSSSIVDSAVAYCTIPDPLSARNLVGLVSDLVNTNSFVGIDHGDIKAILQSGGHGIFASNEATGADSGTLACKQALEHLQQCGINATTCRGAMACIYGSPDMPFDLYSQAITALDSYFPTDLSFVFGTVVDEKINNVVRVSVLAMK
ncbi:MAG: hypothetical protein OEL57_11590 [Trichlorobacter sp.]|nr:hypothetical protein [Trichlorobacter sp.]